MKNFENGNGCANFVHRSDRSLVSSLDFMFFFCFLGFLAGFRMVSMSVRFDAPKDWSWEAGSVYWQAAAQVHSAAGQTSSGKKW